MIGRKGSCVYWRPSKAAQKQARPESVIRKRSNCTTLLTNGRDVAELEDAEAAIASLEAASQSPHLRDCIHSDSVPNSRKSEVKRQLSCGFLDDDGDAWEPWEDVRSAHGPAALSGDRVHKGSQASPPLCPENSFLVEVCPPSLFLSCPSTRTPPRTRASPGILPGVDNEGLVLTARQAEGTSCGECTEKSLCGIKPFALGIQDGKGRRRRTRESG